MPRYQYIKIPKHRHPITLSYVVRTDSTDPNLLITVGVAICRNDDPFSKEFGRKVADGRLMKSPHYVAFSGLDTSKSFGKRIIDSLHKWVESSWKDIIKDT